MVLVTFKARATAVSVLAFALIDVYGAPLPITDQNPFMAGFSPPAPLSARLEPRATTSGAVAFNWSSTAAIQHPATEQLVVDLETREWRTTVDYSITDDWALRLTIPYREHTGGTLDSAVEEWHSWFGFPDGDRPQLDQDQVRIEYRKNGSPALRFDGNESGVGDASIDLGYQISAATTRATSLWGSIKFPTGESEYLNGSESWGGSISVAHEQALGSRWAAFAQLGVSYLADGELLGELQRNWLSSGLLGINYRPTSAVSVTLQLDGHSAPYESELRLLGPAWLMTLGAEFRMTSRWMVAAAIVEDVYVESSPDVSFVLRLSGLWR